MRGLNNFPNDFIDGVIRALDKFAPFKDIKLNNKIKQVPWISDNIRQLMKERDRLNIIAINSNNEID